MADPTTRFVTKANAKAIVQGLKSVYTNQNAIAKFKVGNTTYTADEAQDLIELIAGTNVGIAIDNDKITFSATDTTYSAATPSTSGVGGTDGLLTAADKEKLNGIDAGAEVNQNAFSNITVGSDTIAADAKTDTIEFIGGTNVTITTDASGNITFAAADTTYTLVQDQNDGHTFTFTPSNGQPVTITIPDSDTTYDAVDANGTDPGLMTVADKVKLDGVEADADVNIIEGVKVNGTSLSPTNKIVDVTVTAGDTGVGTIKVNGTQMAVHGLGGAAGEDVSTGIADGDSGLVTGDQVYDYVAGVVASAYKAAGSLAPNAVASSLLVAANEGKVYNLSGDLTLDSTSAALFVDGAADDVIEAGTNIVIVDAGSSTFKFDKLAGFVDLSPYVESADLGGLTAAEIQEILAEA
jgi:hypothetical protein